MRGVVDCFNVSPYLNPASWKLSGKTIDKLDIGIRIAKEYVNPHSLPG